MADEDNHQGKVKEMEIEIPQLEKSEEKIEQPMDKKTLKEMSVYTRKLWYLWLGAIGIIPAEVFKLPAVTKALNYALKSSEVISFVESFTNPLFTENARAPLRAKIISRIAEKVIDSDIISGFDSLWEADNITLFEKYSKDIKTFIDFAAKRGIMPAGFYPKFETNEDGEEIIKGEPPKEIVRSKGVIAAVAIGILDSYKTKLKSMLEDVSNKLKKGNLSEDVISILSDFKRNLEKALDDADSISSEQIIPILSHLQDQRAEIYDKTGQKIGGEGALNAAKAIGKKQVEASSSQKAVGEFFFKKLPLLLAFYLMFYIPIKQNLATTEILFYILLGYAFFPTVGMKIVFFLLFLAISLFGESIIPYSDMAYSTVTTYFGAGLQYVAIAIGIVLGLNWFSPMFAKYGGAKNILGAICGAIMGALLIFPIIDIIMLLPSGMNQSFSCSLFCGLKDIIMQPLYGMFGAVAPVCATTYIIGCIALIVTALVSFGNWLWKIIIYAIVFIGLPAAAPLILGGWNLVSSWGWFAGPDAVATRVLTMPALNGNLVVLLFALTPLIEITLKFLRNKADLWKYGAEKVAQMDKEHADILQQTVSGRIQLRFRKLDNRILEKIDAGIARRKQNKAV